jgi:hypothetical protein
MQSDRKIRWYQARKADGGAADLFQTFFLKIYYKPESLCKSFGVGRPKKECGSLFKPALDPVVPMDRGRLHFMTTGANTNEEPHHSLSPTVARERLL